MKPNEVLKTKRCERKLSLVGASMKTRIPKATYVRIEAGKNQPSLVAAHAIEQQFGIPMSAWVSHCA